jgi:hypothetical protein
MTRVANMEAFKVTATAAAQKTGWSPQKEDVHKVNHTKGVEVTAEAAKGDDNTESDSSE